VVRATQLEASRDRDRLWGADGKGRSGDLGAACARSVDVRGRIGGEGSTRGACEAPGTLRYDEIDLNKERSCLADWSPPSAFPT